jgi:predicted permease
MRSVAVELWQAMRALRRHPALSLTAIGTIAAGIAATTSLFSVIHGVLVRPLPYRAPEELVLIRENAGAVGWMSIGASGPSFLDYRTRGQAFASVAGYEQTAFNLTGVDEPERIRALVGTPDLLSTLGIAPAIGRSFTPDEAVPGSRPVVVLGAELWRRRFGADPAIAGRTVALDGVARVVVGVLPDGFRFPPSAEPPAALVPLSFDDPDLQIRGSHPLDVIARLRPGVGLADARRDLGRVVAAMAADNPDWYPPESQFSASLLPLDEATVGSVRSALWAMWGATIFVLLIACANVANLLLVRAAARSRELALRSALGGSRWRLVRQVFVESIVLALLGGGVGVLGSLWGVALLGELAPPELPRAAEIAVSVPVLLFAIGVSIVAGLLAGIAPALRTGRLDLMEVLKEGGERSVGTRSGQRTRSALVVAQAALAVVLLVGAGLLLATFRQLRGVRLGFDPEGVVTMSLVLPESRYPDAGSQNRFFDRMLDRVQRIPGARAAAIASSLPLGGRANHRSFEIEGRVDTAGAEPTALNCEISPDYFRAVGTRVVRGRAFDGRDRADAPGVAIANETLVRSYWPGDDPIGKRVKLPGMKGPLEIVGVVEDVRHEQLDEPPAPALYLAHAQRPWRFAMLVVRVEDPRSVADVTRAAQREIQAVDGDLPVYQVSSLDRLLARSLATRRFVMLLLAVFAAVALLLAAVGIYGVLAFVVAQRTREIGIRLALGATPRQIARAIALRSATLAAAGIALGSLGAWALSRVLRGLLYGVAPTDPAVFLASAGTLALAAIVAGLLPALRAARVDPASALRGE